MRTIVGVIVGLVVIFPGITFLKWLTVSSGAYGGATLTDTFLAMIIILLCVQLVRGASPAPARAKSRATARARRTTNPPEAFPGEPQPFLPGDRPARPRRTPTGRRPTTRRER
ncbi:MAG: hypothetical protein WCP21_20350 [Armatimonadota bacterium]